MSGNKELVEQFFVQERKKHRRMVVLLWITAGIGDLFAIVAWLEGVEVKPTRAAFAVDALPADALVEIVVQAVKSD